MRNKKLSLSAGHLGKMHVPLPLDVHMPAIPRKTQDKAPQALSFEAALAELEQVVAHMEAGQLPLEDALAAYKRGAELLQLCRARLQDAQQQVRVLEEGTLKNFSAMGEPQKREDA